MKIFLSWSGKLSQEVARALKVWIPTVLPNVEAWFSSDDIPKGSRWALELAKCLEEANYGIAVLVPGNVNQPWLNFELGAISKSLSTSRMSPFLFDLEPSELSGGPIAQFQATTFQKEDVWRLVLSMNESSGSDRPKSDTLRVAFDLRWPELEERLKALLPERQYHDQKSFTEHMVLRNYVKLHQAESPELSHAHGVSTADPDATNGETWYAGPEIPCPVHIVYGPYESLPAPGLYWAVFKAKIDSNSTPEATLHLDVISNKNPSLNSNRIVRGTHFDEAMEYQLFGVKFEYQNEVDVEYRVIKLVQHRNVWIDFIAIIRD